MEFAGTREAATEPSTIRLKSKPILAALSAFAEQSGEWTGMAKKSSDGDLRAI